jgi:hypothetical protein
VVGVQVAAGVTAGCLTASAVAGMEGASESPVDDAVPATEGERVAVGVA